MLAAAQEAGQFSLMAPISVSGFILESTDDLTQPFHPVGSDPGAGSGVLTFDDPPDPRLASPTVKIYRMRRLE
jgi:hypothetical protein